jgi:hypothetical protein
MKLNRTMGSFTGSVVTIHSSKVLSEFTFVLSYSNKPSISVLGGYQLKRSLMVQTVATSTNGTLVFGTQEAVVYTTRNYIISNTEHVL